MVLATPSSNKDESLKHFGLNELVSDPTFLAGFNFESETIKLNETMETKEGEIGFSVRFDGKHKILLSLLNILESESGNYDCAIIDFS